MHCMDATRLRHHKGGAARFIAIWAPANIRSSVQVPITSPSERHVNGFISVSGQLSYGSDDLRWSHSSQHSAD
jgi:hypothetical protein